MPRDVKGKARLDIARGTPSLSRSFLEYWRTSKAERDKAAAAASSPAATTAYREASDISRPLVGKARSAGSTSYFFANTGSVASPAATSETVNSPAVATTSSAYTPIASSSAPFSNPVNIVDAFVRSDQLPQSQRGIRRLVDAAFALGRKEALHQVVAACQAASARIELAQYALQCILELPIDRPYHQHMEKLNRRTRRALARKSSVLAGDAEALRRRVLANSDSRSIRRAGEPEEAGTLPEPISQELFFQTWETLWQLTGERLDMASDDATQILEHLLLLPPPDGVAGDTPAAAGPREAGAAYRTRALRHLLFLAGIEEHPDLALDLLTSLVSPLALCTPAHLHATSIRLASAGRATVEDMVLILQDLLRSGIIRSSLIAEFNLSGIVNRSLDLPADTFLALLRQVLLRVLVRCYANRYDFDRSTLLLRYLETIEGDTESDRLKDGQLLESVCKAALRASREDGKWVPRVGALLALGLQGRLPFWRKGQHSPPHRLLRYYFDTALPPKVNEHASKRSKYSSAALIWKALQVYEEDRKEHQASRSSVSTPMPTADSDDSASMFGELEPVYQLPLYHLSEVAQTFSWPLQQSFTEDLRYFIPEYADAAQDGQAVLATATTQTKDFLRAIIQMQDTLQDGREGQLTSTEANIILHTVLSSKLTARDFGVHGHNAYLPVREETERQSSEPVSLLSAQQPIESSARQRLESLQPAIDCVAEQIYQLFQASPSLTADTFVLEGKNLVPLVRTLLRLPDPPMSKGPTRASEGEACVRAFLRDKSARHGGIDPIELTGAARAFFLLGNREAGLAVFARMLKERRVPDLVDIRTILVDVAQADPALLVETLAEMIDVGFAVDRATVLSISRVLETRGHLQELAELADMLQARRGKVQIARPSIGRLRNRAGLGRLA